MENSAVDWLVNELEDMEYDLRLIPNIINKAKQMEIDQAEKLKDFDTWKEWKNKN